jgi:hypothetical protein
MRMGKALPVAERLAGRALTIARLALVTACAGALAAAGRPLPL